ncbi:uncharacterized protein LOC121983422 isoform X2 [Zingiber officinale]|uniref:uncharacterized protein LOC121983422 isoform X2 n=1 Tax=Zingiber officinale TaxID=94328 RepID=UPI001C4AD196|nr:uncharacterized protein LOC121983422 isoform X2 [Zingiber officinale]
MAAIGWYGPLIDLSRVVSHVDDLVQLLVFVRDSQPVVLQKSNTSNGGTLLKTKLQVSDDTRSIFSVSLWPKHMGSVIAAGDVVLLQKILLMNPDVKIVKYRDVLEATTVQVSLLHVLLHSRELNAFEGVEEWQPNIKLLIGNTTREKLRRVVDWVQHTESALQHAQHLDSSHRLKREATNWKAHEENVTQCCSSISEVSIISNSSNVIFHASVQEILLPATWILTGVEDIILSYKSLIKMVDSKTLEFLIGTGCRLCGIPIASRNSMDVNRFPLYCQNTSDYIHKVCKIYRPFMLYVWDKTGRIPLLVKNKPAETLFGNITAEMVYECYQEGSWKHLTSVNAPDRCDSPCENHKKQKEDSTQTRKDIYGIWLCLLKLLLQHEKNSPFQFEISVVAENNIESSRFELVSVRMPCHRDEASSA